MSLHDYSHSIEISATIEPSFATLIMCAMRKADSDNVELLRACWPEIWDECYARYNSPGGRLPSERGGL